MAAEVEAEVTAQHGVRDWAGGVGDCGPSGVHLTGSTCCAFVPLLALIYMLRCLSFWKIVLFAGQNVGVWF